MEYLSDTTYEVLQKATDSFKEGSGSKKQYYGYVKRIAVFLQKDFGEITREDTVRYFDHLKKGKKKKTTLATALGIYRAVASAYDKMLGTELITSFSGISIENGPKELSAYDLPYFDDVNEVLAHLKKKRDYQTFAIISVVMQTALTSGELCLLKIQDLRADVNDDFYLRLEPKSPQAHPRYFLLGKDVADVLMTSVYERGKRIFPTDALFVNSRENPLSQRQMEQAVRNACDEASVAPFTLNDIRTLAMAIMLKTGIPTDKLMDITDNTGRWLFRLNRVVGELPNKNIALKHVKITW